MAWITPKTDWSDAKNLYGVYIGDYFSYVDFNRIRNNLAELTELGEMLYMFNFTTSLPNEKTVTGYPYASDINAFETRLHEINAQSVKLSIGEQQTFTDNGAFIDADELNRIESAMLRLYNILHDSVGGRRMLPFTLGFEPSSVRF